MPTEFEQEYEEQFGGEALTLPEVIGLPPDDPRVLPAGYPQFSKVFMPIMTLVPKLPEVSTDFTVYHLRNAVQEYNDIAGNLLPSVNLRIDRALKVAFLLESAPSETFSTQYGESFLESMSGAVSTAAADITFITGQERATEALRRLSEALSKGGGFFTGLAGATVGGLAAGIEAVKAALGSRFKRLGTILEGLLAGNRVDFPEVWKGSSYETAYSVTVRLYNPCPDSPEMTIKYIIAPLAALLLFVVPQIPDKQEYMYKYPFLCSFKCPGLFEVKYGAITSINVIKGGDQTHIAYNQIPGIVDLRIDLHELFSTLVVRKSGQKKPGIPTLKEYLEAFIDPHTRSKTANWKQAVGTHRPRATEGVVMGKEGTLRPASQYSPTSPLRQSQVSGQSLLTSETAESSSRVSDTNKQRSNDLSNQMPSGVIV